MSSHFQRGELLFEQSRYEQAAGELTAHLGENPDDALAHSLLAISQAHLKQFDDALAHAQEAIGLEPDDGFAHYSLALVEMERCRFEAAATALDEAIRCSPFDPSFHGLMAAIRARQQKWPAALEAAEQGLEHEPDNLQCLNMRAMALRQLGHNVAAAATMRDALARDPNDGFAHANQGWALLEEGHVQQALNHFREALRIEPELEYARLGILEALKAENPVYRAILRYLLWSGKQPVAVQWGIVLGMIVALRMADGLGTAIPPLAPLLWLFNTIVLLAAVSTFFARPFFNFVLLFHPLGRLAMTRNQKAQGLLTAVLASLYFALFLWSRLTTGWRWHDEAFMVLAVMAIPALSIHDCQEGWPRWAAIGLMLVGPVLFFLPLLAALVLPGSPWLPLRGTANTVYSLALVIGLFTLCNKLEEIELAEQ